MFDRLPTPFGLVRAGVAPDHPKIKSVIRVYEKTAAREGFQFFGNVDIGADVTVAELEERYHAVVSAYGTATDRRLGIPGEDLPGSHAATEFVNWYNAHPDFADHDFDLTVKRAVVIGNGNVAADVARMLALPHGELNITDTGEPRDREARRAPGSRRSSCSAAAGPPRPRSPTPRCASSASSPTPTSSSTRPRSSSTRPAAPTSSPRTASRPTGATSRSSPTSPTARRRASPSAS